MSIYSKIFGERGWERFPTSFVNSLKKTLGAEQFESLTVLAKKYQLFDQSLFAYPQSFNDIHNEITNIQIAGFLTSMGNELGRRNITDDAEKAFRIALTLRPEHSAAFVGLTALCYSNGRLSEAKEYARKAMADLDVVIKRHKELDIPEYISNPQDISSLREFLQSIIDQS